MDTLNDHLKLKKLTAIQSADHAQKKCQEVKNLWMKKSQYGLVAILNSLYVKDFLLV